jgi:1,5-anhydro-D-fructose reductase (1,5-anhydro-D-mannitol-forming)
VIDQGTHPRLGWGLVGTSGWADHTFAPAVRNGGGELLGAAGSSPGSSEAFARRHGAPHTYKDLDALLADDDIGAVWIASPTDLHCEQALRALEAGKHVLVEKPMATSVGDAEAMAAAARSARTLTAVGFQHRFNPSHQRLRELVRTNALGDLVYFRLHQFIKAEALPTPWRQDPGRSGGWAVNDLGTHVLDLARFLVGEIEVVGGGLAAAHFNLPVDDLAVILIQFERAQGATFGTVEVSTTVPETESQMEVYGTGGVARVAGSWPGGGRLSAPTGQETFEVVDTYAAQVAALGAAIAEGSAYDGATWDDGLANVRLVEALTERGSLLLQTRGAAG